MKDSEIFVEHVVVANAILVVRFPVNSETCGINRINIAKGHMSENWILNTISVPLISVGPILGVWYFQRWRWQHFHLRPYPRSWDQHSVTDLCRIIQENFEKSDLDPLLKSLFSLRKEDKNATFDLSYNQFKQKSRTRIRNICDYLRLLEEAGVSTRQFLVPLRKTLATLKRVADAKEDFIEAFLGFLVSGEYLLKSELVAELTEDLEILEEKAKRMWKENQKRITSHYQTRNLGIVIQEKLAKEKSERKVV